ncbi:MAG: hypothetical protein HY459_02480 [Parcubacteria group bacterium]|nr:hypothetical protein [Parcubacteria group bacterium]
MKELSTYLHRYTEFLAVSNSYIRTPIASVSEALRVRKNKFTAAALIATFLLALPISPARAQMAQMFVSLGSAGFGEPFIADVMVSDLEDLAGYDFTVFYNPDILAVTGTSLGNTAFDLNDNGDVSDDPVFIARAEVFNTIGEARYAVVLLGGLSVTPRTSASLLKLTFMVDSSASASDYPPSICTGSSSLISLIPGVGTIEVPHTSTCASFMPSPDVALRSVGCRADLGGLNTQAHGFTDGLFCRVVNNGAQAIEVRADFFWGTGSASSPTMTLQPGAAAELRSSITVPNNNDVFIITGTPVRLITLPDSSVLTIPGESDTFKIVVNVP